MALSLLIEILDHPLTMDHARLLEKVSDKATMCVALRQVVDKVSDKRFAPCLTP